jgi:hypothetical protein
MCKYVHQECNHHHCQTDYRIFIYRARTHPLIIRVSDKRTHMHHRLVRALQKLSFGSDDLRKKQYGQSAKAQATRSTAHAYYEPAILEVGMQEANFHDHNLGVPVSVPISISILCHDHNLDVHVSVPTSILCHAHNLVTSLGVRILFSLGRAHSLWVGSPQGHGDANKARHQPEQNSQEDVGQIEKANQPPGRLREQGH